MTDLEQELVGRISALLTELQSNPSAFAALPQIAGLLEQIRAKLAAGIGEDDDVSQIGFDIMRQVADDPAFRESDLRQSLMELAGDLP